MLIARLLESVESDNGEPEIDQGEVEVTNDNDAEEKIEGMEEDNI